MKIMTVLGTRPEIIRLSGIIGKLDSHSRHALVHTGQNSDECLRDVFFKELGIRTPDYSLGIKAGGFGGQIGKILSETDKIFAKEKPDKILILGDTNSGLSAIPAKRRGIEVCHLEAGNRCYDDRVPEELNRRIIDHSSDILMPYTQRSKDNLVREGIPRERIFVVGNPIKEVLDRHSPKIERSAVLSKLRLKKNGYFLATLHRAENVDVEKRLRNFVKVLSLVAAKHKMPVVCSLHPHTKDRMERLGTALPADRIRSLVPPGFFDFVALEKNAFCVLTDSGTVQEECCLFHKPVVTLRDVTERPETLECGSNILSGDDPEEILNAVDLAVKEAFRWSIPPEYLENNVSSKVLKIILGYHDRRCG